MATGTKGKVKDTVSIISNFVSTFLITLVVMVAAILVAVRFCNFSLLNVESGSMYPYLGVNTLIAVKEAEFEEIETGDVITYVMNDQLTLVTHRVVSIDRADQTFTTKGDANNTNDPKPILYENVVGKVVFKIPKIGAVVSVISAEENRQYVIAAIAVLVALVLISDVVEKQRNAKRQKAAAQPNRNKISAKETPAENETDSGTGTDT